MTKEEAQALDDLLEYCSKAIAQKFKPKEPAAPKGAAPEKPKDK